MKLSTVGNIAKKIFEADIKFLNITDFCKKIIK